jgi:hypothetical protein
LSCIWYKKRLSCLVFVFLAFFLSLLCFPYIFALAPCPLLLALALALALARALPLALPLPLVFIFVLSCRNLILPFFSVLCCTSPSFVLFHLSQYYLVVCCVMPSYVLSISSARYIVLLFVLPSLSLPNTPLFSWCICLAGDLVVTFGNVSVDNCGDAATALKGWLLFSCSFFRPLYFVCPLDGFAFVLPCLA